MFKQIKSLVKQGPILPLTHKLKGRIVKLIDINFEDKYIIHRLTNLGFVKNAIIKVLDFNYSITILHLELNNVQYVLREDNCRSINVQVIK